MPPSSRLAPRRGELPSAVTIREVGPRDGLQGEEPLPPRRRADLALALIAAGCDRVEVASFVSERAVPAMAGAAQVVSLVRDSLEESRNPKSAILTALVANLRGATEALASGIDEITVTVAASPGYNERNVRRSIDESVAEIKKVTAEAARSNTPVDAVISCAFGSPYETSIPPATVSRLATRLVERGCAHLTLADTTGVANPVVISRLLGELAVELPEVSLGLHLHETRGTALANAYAALELGVRRFDTSVGGLGGSPFAEGAGGNLSTEDFVSFLHSLGIRTGIDLQGVCEAALLARQLVGHELASKVRSKS